MVLLVFVLGVLMAIWPKPVLRLAGGRAHSSSTVRMVGAALAAMAALTALTIGP